MTSQPRKRPMRRLVAHFLRPELCFSVAKKPQSARVSRETRRIDDRVRSIIAKALS
jgi:hypothetical protein